MLLAPNHNVTALRVNNIDAYGRRHWRPNRGLMGCRGREKNNSITVNGKDRQDNITSRQFRVFINEAFITDENEVWIVYYYLTRDHRRAEQMREIGDVHRTDIVFVRTCLTFYGRQ